MKKTAVAIFSFMTILILFPCHVSGAPAYEGGMTFKYVEGKEWVLEELRSDGKTVYFDRKKLEAEGLRDVYTIIFRDSGEPNGSQVNGMGAPNRYFGPYTSFSNRTISIGNLASTMMMAFREPDGLKENEYFTYLSRITRWDMREGKLELHSSNTNGSEAVLVFTVK